MKAIKKSDIILLICIILAGAILLCIFSAIFLKKGQTVVVKVNGEEYARLPLKKDTELLIEANGGTNLLIIRDGKAWVESASCPKQICVADGELSELDPIVCNHHSVSITLE
ncbi:MAG: NusG domain II-containing protein [Clostridia bacterium]|nr:NusG domain II-containing protein [Clostridia bacterium]